MANEMGKRYICKKCGLAREKIYQDTGNMIGQGGFGSKTADHIKASPTSSLLTKKVKEKEYKGYTDCGCNAGFRPGIILDPFAGSGTTGEEAIRQGKDYILIEIKKDYLELIKKRMQVIQVNLI